MIVNCNFLLDVTGILNNFSSRCECNWFSHKLRQGGEIFFF